MLGAVAVSLGPASTASAQSYPMRPVRVIVPFAAGGPTDVLARLVANRLSESTGQQFYIENLGGAGGNIGTSRAAQAIADGYTILVTGSNYVINPALYEKVAYDPLKDFDPVTLAATSAVVVTVNPSVPAKTVKELISLIKSTPGKFSYASPGAGTPPHLVGELFRLSFGLDLVHVPFKGGGEAVGSTVAGHTPICFVAMAPAVPQVQDGKLQALAVTTQKRCAALPDVATMAEAGFPDIAGESWLAVLVPAGTPKDVTTRLNGEIAKIVALPDVSERLVMLGYEPVAGTPEECAARFKADAARWQKVIRAAGITFK